MSLNNNQSIKKNSVTIAHQLQPFALADAM